MFNRKHRKVRYAKCAYCGKSPVISEGRSITDKNELVMHYKCPKNHLTTGDTPYPNRALELLRRNDDGLRACNQLLPSHARLFRHHAFRGTQSKRGREGIVMWFKRRRNEYGCPMCGRLPVIRGDETREYHESRKVTTKLTVYRLQCPRGHISTSWFSYPAYASRQWKQLVDEYKREDTK